MNKTEPNISSYWIYGLFSSLLMGGVFAYMFLWKMPGISVPIFYLLLVINAFLPLYIFEKDQVESRLGKGVYLVVAGFLFTSLFLYRLEAITIYAFLLLPVLYGTILAAAYIPGTMRNQSVPALLMLPFIMMAAWFGDIVTFLQNMTLRFFKNARSKSIFWRVIAGVAISLPFLLVFMAILSSADLVFAELTENFFDDLIKAIFTDWETFWSNVWKLIVATLVAIYLMVFNFSLWNRKSFLTKMLNDYNNRKMQRKEMTQSWDFIIVNVFIGMTNVLFLTFVLIQFIYLFAGNTNVIGEDATYTYSEYVRKGFNELIVISSLIFFIGWLLNAKTKLVSSTNKMIFNVNYSILLLCTFIIAISAQYRIFLIEDAYGFTATRLLGHLTTSLIMLLIITLAVSLYSGSKWFVRVMLLGSVLVAFTAIFMVPTDYVVAKMNYTRYQNGGDMDFAHLQQLSDEIVPVLYEMATDEDNDEGLRLIALAELEYRAADRPYYLRNEIDNTDKLPWQSYTLIGAINGRIFDSLDEDADYLFDFEEHIRDIVDGYGQLLVDEQYNEAFKKYWSSYAQMNNVEDLAKYKITKYEVVGIDFDESRHYSSSYDNDQTPQWVRVDVEFSYSGEGYYGQKEYCNRDSLYFRLEGGEWKIIRSGNVPVGAQKDNTGSRFYDQYSNFEHFESLTYEQYECGDGYPAQYR